MAEKAKPVTERDKLTEAMAISIWRASALNYCDARDLDAEWAGFADFDREPYLKQARAALAALEAAHVVVPREPTSEMVIAGQEVFLDNGYTHGQLNDTTLRKAYKAMIGAAHE